MNKSIELFGDGIGKVEYVQHMGEDITIVNGASYSSDDGYAYTMLGVYEGNIGDIATIWVGYYDNYGNQWLDSIKVIIDE